MDALILGAAPEPGGEAHYRGLLDAAAFVIAADAAAEWAVSLGRVPDLAVGDFDSAEEGAPERLEALGVEVVRHPEAKDASDLDLALDEARRRGSCRVTFAGVTSGRLDHTLASLGTLASAADLDGALDEPSVAGWALAGRASAPLSLRGPAGALVSIFAFGSTAEGVTLSGLRYPLREATLREPSSLGLSNELTGGEATVTVATGRLLVLSAGHPAMRAARC